MIRTTGIRNGVLLSVFAATLLITSNAFACPQAQPIVYQRLTLDRVLGSPEFSAAIGQAVATYSLIQISSIEFLGRDQLKVPLSNGCSIFAEVKMIPPDMIGACPRFDKVEATLTCP